MFDSTGANVAHYEYDSFGLTINSSGSLKDAEPGTRNAERGTRNPEPGTRNPEPYFDRVNILLTAAGVVAMIR